MGLGVKVTGLRVATADSSHRALNGAPLPFVVVARVRCASRLEEAMEACKSRGLGGERGYGVIKPSKHVCLIYDIARSPAWYVNKSDDTPLGGTTAHLTLGSHWVPYFKPTDGRHFGDHILAKYGTASDHHRTITAEAEERAMEAEEAAFGVGRGEGSGGTGG